jgi:DNA-binding transcriptional regulator LsrR (DeoR family)
LIEPTLTKNRQVLLADIAEMYFLEGKTQAEIADAIGATRSNISRMLTEARNSGIVLIQIKRPLQEDTALAQQLIERFDLVHARVINVDQSTQRLNLLGKAAGNELVSHLKPGWVIGTSWGTAISTTVEEIEGVTPPAGIRVVQLLGALGARIAQYDAHAIVRRLADKLDAEGVYLNAPFLVEDQNIARSLLANRSIAETLSFGKQADIALLGVGSSDPEHSSYYLADYVNKQDMLEIQKTGAIGDVCGRFYDINGKMTAFEFQNRLIGISANNLTNIPIRIGVAGGPAKVGPIIGALRSKLINILVSDTQTVTDVLAKSN